MFVELSGEVFKVLKKEADGNWLISYENPSSPIFVTEQEMNRMNRIEPPAEYQKNCMQTERTPGLRKRREMVAELLADESFITDKEKRRAKVREIAEREHCMRLHHLRPAHLEAVFGDEAVQSHVLALERHGAQAVLRKDAAERRAEQTFTCTAHRTLHHDAFCPAHPSTSFISSSSRAFSGAVRTAVRYHSGPRPG